jgi:hypothetical protein
MITLYDIWGNIIMQDDLESIKDLCENFGSLKYVNLKGANLKGAILHDMDLEGANLMNANLKGANLRYTNLSYSDMRGANIENADLRNVDLRKAKIDFKYIYLKGSKDDICAYLDCIWVGCKCFKINKLLKRYKILGERYGYTDEEIVEYGEYFNFIKEQFGYNKSIFDISSSEVKRKAKVFLQHVKEGIIKRPQYPNPGANYGD